MIRSIVALLQIGTPAPLRGRGGDSSIASRRPVDGPVALSRSGLIGDAVGDPRHHGGPDKAVHLYPTEHYPAWVADLGAGTPADAPGGFGENIAAPAMREGEVAVGDRFRIGSTLLEVSHGRQPCNTINRVFARVDMVERSLATMRCGYYFRVIEEGELAPGDAIEQVAAGDPDWTVARLIDLFFRGGWRDEPDALRAAAAMPVLAEAWRKVARARLKALG